MILATVLAAIIALAYIALWTCHRRVCIRRYDLSRPSTGTTPVRRASTHEAA